MQDVSFSIPMDAELSFELIAGSDPDGDPLTVNQDLPMVFGEIADDPDGDETLIRLTQMIFRSILLLYWL